MTPKPWVAEQPRWNVMTTPVSTGIRKGKVMNSKPVTPKQVLRQHLVDLHGHDRGSTARKTYDELQRDHAYDHWRHEWRYGHVHWDGTEDDRNRSGANRPEGWYTGRDVRFTRDTKKLYRDVVAGDRFMSPRAEEGKVEAVCTRGECVHDERDRYSTHVRSLTTGNEFFVLADPGTELWEGNTVTLVR